MNKRIISMSAAGLLATVGLVAVPGIALASQQAPTPAPTASSSEMAQMMTDEEFRQQMKDMMSDAELREQMRSMMSDGMRGMRGMSGMSGMDGSKSGDMSGMDMQS